MDFRTLNISNLMEIANSKIDEGTSNVLVNNNNNNSNSTSTVSYATKYTWRNIEFLVFLILALIETKWEYDSGKFKWKPQSESHSET